VLQGQIQDSQLLYQPGSPLCEINLFMATNSHGRSAQLDRKYFWWDKHDHVCLFVVYFTMLFQYSKYRVKSEWWIPKDVKGNGYGLLSRYYPSKMRAFWDIASCSLRLNWRFRGAYCLHNQGDESRVNSLAWWWMRYVPLKHQSTLSRLHGAISEKAVIFILADVRTWTLIYHSRICVEGLRKTTKTSLRTLSLRAEIWSRDLPNMKKEC
jgi:hypothetical protein